MKTAIYIVIYARDAWWIDLDGESDGPFGTRDAAIQQSIALAQAKERDGGRSEVRVVGGMHGNDLVYQSARRSLLSRAVAMGHVSA